MKTKYKGFEIDIRREQALGGWDNIYYSVMRESDGWFLCDSFSTGEDKLKDFANDLKNVVDDYLENPNDYEDES